MKPVRAILIGAGDRGRLYSDYALRYPGKLKITAVAEPVDARREKIAELHHLPASMVFNGWEELLYKNPDAEGAIIATQDGMHVEPAVAAMNNGYQVLLEKPMAITPEGCAALVEASHKTGLTLNICHVLRYTNLFSKIKEIIDTGSLGDIYNIYHAENVSYYHMAHSFVRGNWGNGSKSSPMILAKCCHDLDLLYWFAGSEPRRISSFGSLHHFIPANAPAGAPGRCTDGCPAEKTCPYYSVNTYLRGISMKRALTKTDSVPVAFAARFMLRFPRLAAAIPGLRQYAVWKEWPTSTITDDLAPEGIMKALREGPYGRCVYHSDNDQVDHQVTAVEFENGVTAMLNMHGHSHEEGRTLRIEGARATLRGKFGGGGGLEVHVHLTGKKIKYSVRTDLLGHSEGDEGIMDNFVNVLRGGRGLTTADESLTSHLMAFAAHRARVEKKVVEMQSMKRN